MGMKLFNRTKDNVFHPISKKQFGADNLEKTLEDWMHANPHLLGDDILFIGRQVRTDHGIIDLLALDSKGNTVIIELKRGRATREVVGQLNSYLTIADSWSESELVRNANLVPFSRETNNLIKKFKEHFKCSEAPDFNRQQIGVVVAEEYEADFVPQIGGLRFDCRVLQFSSFVDQLSEEYLLVNTLHDSTPEDDSEETDSGESEDSEYSRVTEEVKTRFLKLVDEVQALVENGCCAEAEGWRVHRSKRFVQAVFSCWKIVYEGISLYHEPETGKQYLCVNCLPKHNRTLSARLKENKKTIEMALGKNIRWDMSSWESVCEIVGNDPSEIAERIKLYVQTLKPYLDEALPERRSNGAVGDIPSVQLEFWKGFEKYSIEAGSELKLPTLRAKGYIQITLEGQLLVCIASTNRIAVYLALKGENREKIFKLFVSGKTSLDKQFGEPLKLELLPDRMESQVLTLFERGKLLDRNTWPETYKWMLKSMEKFKVIFTPRLQKLRGR